MLEKSLAAKLRLAAPKHDARLFRNQVGTYKLVDGRYLTSGLGTGSPDLIGWKTVPITSAMVGTKIAVFVGLELKSAGKEPSDEQIQWLRQIVGSGGIAGYVSTEEQGIAFLKHQRKGEHA